MEYKAHRVEREKGQAGSLTGSGKLVGQHLLKERETYLQEKLWKGRISGNTLEMERLPISPPKSEIGLKLLSC